MQYPLSPRTDRPARFPGRTPWPGVELRHLIALQAVAAAGSFNGAAARLGYTQSAVSAQIRALERLTGVRVIDRARGARSIALTREGAVLLRYATEIVAQFEAAADDLAGVSDRSELRVGTFRSASLAIVAPALARLPEVRASLVELPDEDALLDLLVEGELDVSFALAPVRTGLEATLLRREGYVAVIPRGDDLALRPEIRVRDLAGRRVLTEATRHGALLAHAALGHGAVASTLAEDATVLAALAAASAGVALLPELAFAGSADAVARPLVGELPERTIALAWHGDLVRSVQAAQFAKAAVAVARTSPHGDALAS